MYARFLMIVILMCFGANFASAGIMVRAEQVPEAVVSMSMPVDDDAPALPAAFQQGDLSLDLTVTSSHTSGSSVAMSVDAFAASVDVPMAEFVRVWSSTLPTCPFLEAKLKPA
ncbi:hypothetical protein [Allorhodopirellula solitaria]|nr:hypothetical protein [Allorhodopirellula solitaria]